MYVVNSNIFVFQTTNYGYPKKKTGIPVGWEMHAHFAAELHTSQIY